MDAMEELRIAIYAGDAQKVESITLESLKNHINPKVILDEGLIMGMEKVGTDFRCGDLFIPEVLLAAQAMKASMSVLRPLFVENGIEPIGRIVIGTVEGDLHDIGKNLVGMMLEGGGFEVIDLGVDVAPEKFIEATRLYNPRVLCMSALLTTTMDNMKKTIQAVNEAGFRQTVKIIVGGAPVTPQYAHDIGADGFAPDAGSAVMTVKELLM
jgi:5-methyltetrahydrofolate--homocysteine methyltransferase